LPSPRLPDPTSPDRGVGVSSWTLQSPPSSRSCPTPLLHEVRSGLEQAAAEADLETDLGLWFLARRDALPGMDLPGESGYLPV
jgi:hypothetical protein